jgi:hypothetical protein
MLKPLKGNQQRSRVSTGASVPAPVGGWDAISPLAAMKSDRAIVLDNWFPQPGYIEVRRGHIVHAGGIGTGVVDTLMKYQATTSAAAKLFAIGGGAIYDVTSEQYGTITSVTGLSSNRWQSVNYTTSSGNSYLWACSGSDTPQMYNGTVWANPSISGVTSSSIINVNVHKNRLWFCLADSMKAAYLNTDSIQGTATPFNLGSVMGKGGFLVTMGTWTHDAGSGPDDYAVFVSSRGQAAVYQGTDPTSSTTWSLVGVYDMATPIGYRCLTKVAGDLALVTIDGVLPFSVAKGVDRGADAAVSLTANINTAMNIAARSYKDHFGWELVAYPKGMRAILNVPIIEGDVQHQYVMNTLTGAWCRFTGMNANTWINFNDNLYFGGNHGVVYQADTGSIDVAVPVDAIGQGAYQYFKSPGVLKQYNAIQPLVTTDANTRPAIGISTDFKDNATLGTPTSAVTLSALYDTAVYDTDVYPTESRNISDWTSINGIGQNASIHFRSKTGDDLSLQTWNTANWGTGLWETALTGDTVVQLNGFNIIYERGEFI